MDIALKSLPEETVPVSSLKPHPRNYRTHPDDQIGHLIASMEKHGVYRNVVIARDGTILAGHGVVEAAHRMGLPEVPARRLDVQPDDVRALEVLTGDNEVDHLGAVDDRALSELLKEIHDNDIDGLLGTGYDEMMLANLAFVTRPASEIADHDEAAHWVGMPEYELQQQPLKIVVSFGSEADREEFAVDHGLEFVKKESATWMTRHPFRGRDDRASLRFEG